MKPVALTQTRRDRASTMLLAAFGFSIGCLLAAPSPAEPHPDADRIVSIGGAVTEIVFALGEQERLVARDTTSLYPPEVMDLPDVGYIRQLSPEGVLSVEPDLILAEEGAGPPEIVSLLKESGVGYEVIPSGYNAAGLAGKVTAVAEAIGVPEKAGPVLDAIQTDLQELSDRVATQGEKRRVLFILSVQGGRIMASGQGTAADEIIRMAGAENAIQGFSGYKILSDEAVSEAAPDILLMMNRGEATSEHDASDDVLFAMPALATTPAAETGAVIRMDGDYLLGFGPRTGKAALELHDTIYAGS
ncbi:hemin ABC transporter substrate-binding protein [Paracoccus sp. SCSIO 75233]|uniref:heme/hemin ABC transporter substrate-binding protein n=1 Tax=Paracoccus sp. SCSIO 75233 TaxID=3017782 RepID=UPI0022EFEA2A|nr:ABC transporter substrate-binding protein [Paracoccus sp. SCSIO 75233]WBU52201.1 ABC transporter substrate-binding protein [Paracoccus sp. SCSIO 75233]